MQKRIGAHDEVNAVAGPVEFLPKAPHGINGVKNAPARAIHARFRQRRHKTRMRRARQGYHGEAMLVGAKLRGRLVRRPAGGNKENAIEVKAPLGRTRYGHVAGVDRVEGAAKKRDVPASGRFRAARGGSLGFHLCSAAFKISPRPKPSWHLHRASRSEEHTSEL